MKNLLAVRIDRVTNGYNIPQMNINRPGLTEFGPPIWLAKADTELTLPASPATAVGQILLVYGNCSQHRLCS